jgi:hypothetical protein
MIFTMKKKNFKLNNFILFFNYNLINLKLSKIKLNKKFPFFDK